MSCKCGHEDIADAIIWRKAHNDVCKERDALRERLAALEGAVVRLLDALGIDGPGPEKRAIRTILSGKGSE